MPASSPNRSTSLSSPSAPAAVGRRYLKTTGHVLDNNVTMKSPKANTTMTSSNMNNNPHINRISGRRESRPITSIATTSVPSSSGAVHHRPGLSTSAAATRTQDTTFSLPIDIIDTPDLDELCLSPVG